MARLGYAVCLSAPERQLGAAMAKYAAVVPDAKNAPSAIAEADAEAASSESWTTLTTDGRKARYGIAYILSICAQVCVNLQEMSPDEDVLAVDCDIKFPRGNVSAQIK